MYTLWDFFSFKDKFCEKRFSWNFNVYLKSKCILCEKRFSCHGNLNEHESTHSEEKPLKCKFCEKRYSWNGNCIKHEHVSEENHSNVLVAPILNYVSIYKAIMGKVLQMSIM